MKRIFLYGLLKWSLKLLVGRCRRLYSTHYSHFRIWLVSAVSLLIGYLPSSVKKLQHLHFMLHLQFSLHGLRRKHWYSYLTWKETGGSLSRLLVSQKVCIQVARLKTLTNISTTFREMSRAVPGEGDCLWLCRKKERDRLLVKSPSETAPDAG